MNIIISIKQDYLPNNSREEEMRTLFELPHSYNTENNYYLFTGDDGGDKLYIVEALPYDSSLFENQREFDMIDLLDLEEDDNNYYVFHDKDIINENDANGDSYHTTFVRKEYEGHPYWLFQHMPGDRMYKLLTCNSLDLRTMFNELRLLLEI